MTDAEWLRTLARTDYTTNGSLSGIGTEMIAVAARIDIVYATLRAQKEETEGLHEWIEATEQLLHHALRQADATGTWPREDIAQYLERPSKGPFAVRASRLVMAERWITLARKERPELAQHIDGLLTDVAAQGETSSERASLPPQYVEER